MNSENNSVILLGLTVVACVVILLSIIVHLENQNYTLKTEAVARGFAHYNSTNGVWQWNTVNTNR